MKLTLKWQKVSLYVSDELANDVTKGDLRSILETRPGTRFSLLKDVDRFDNQFFGVSRAKKLKFSPIKFSKVLQR